MRNIHSKLALPVMKISVMIYVRRSKNCVRNKYVSITIECTVSRGPWHCRTVSVTAF